MVVGIQCKKSLDLEVKIAIMGGGSDIWERGSLAIGVFTEQVFGERASACRFWAMLQFY